MAGRNDGPCGPRVSSGLTERRTQNAERAEPTTGLSVKKLLTTGYTVRPLEAASQGKEQIDNTHYGSYLIFPVKPCVATWELVALWLIEFSLCLCVN